MFYKVFRIVDGKLASVNSSRFALAYKPGSVTLPCEGTDWIKGFATQQDASNWAATCTPTHEYQVWECEGMEIANPPTHIGWGGFDSYDSYWKIVKELGHVPTRVGVTNVDPFYGMVFVATCRPVRRVEKLPCAWIKQP